MTTCTKTLVVLALLTTLAVAAQQAENLDRATLGALTVERLKETGTDPKLSSEVEEALKAYARKPSDARWAAFSTQASTVATQRTLLLQRRNFMAEVALRLHGSVPPEDREQLANLHATAVNDERALLEKQKWESATERVREIAKRAGAQSRVTFKTAAPGATVKYQTVADRYNNAKPKTVGTLTTGESKLPVAYYFMWTERDGKSTSSTDAQYPIVHEQETVEFAEQTR